MNIDIKGYRNGFTVAVYYVPNVLVERLEVSISYFSRKYLLINRNFHVSV